MTGHQPYHKGRRITEYQVRATQHPRCYRYEDECVVIRFGTEHRILIFADPEGLVSLDDIETALAMPYQITRETEHET
jgi:hypothetical protein